MHVRKEKFNIEIECERCFSLKLCDYCPETDIYEYLCESCALPFKDMHCKGSSGSVRDAK